jgi:lipopolysaccharide export system protein LptC
MHNHHAITYPLFLALMLAILTFWLNQTVQEQGYKQDGSNRHDPDYMLYNFETTQTDLNGAIRYVLTATQMTHYPDDDTTALTQPNFTQYGEDKLATNIQGLRGLVSSNGETIDVLDKVKVTREASANKGEMQLLTDKLTIVPDKDLASTDSAVTIKIAPNMLINGIGMVFDKQKQTMKLLHDVHVHYDKPPSLAKPIANKKRVVN